MIVTSDSPHQSNLRKHRRSVPGQCYFVTTCTFQSEPLFANPGSTEIVVNALTWLQAKGYILLGGYVVMPDHLHVVFLLREGRDLPGVMRSLKGFIGRRLSEKEGRRRQVWLPGYWEHWVRNRKDYIKRLNYMHANPVRKGLAETPDAFPFSTAHPTRAADVQWQYYL